LNLPFGNEPRSALLALGWLGASAIRSILAVQLLIALRVLQDGRGRRWTRVLGHFRSLDGLDALARQNRQWTIVNACATVDLNDDPRDELLNALDLTRLIDSLVELATQAASPFANLPECRARLTVAFHEILIHDGLRQMSTFLRRERARRIASYATCDGLLCSTATRFADKREERRIRMNESSVLRASNNYKLPDDDDIDAAVAAAVEVEAICVIDIYLHGVKPTTFHEYFRFLRPVDVDDELVAVACVLAAFNFDVSGRFSSPDEK